MRACGRALAAARPPPAHQLIYGYVRDPASGERVDEVLAAYMPAPHSYTREDVVEIDSHGGPVPLQRILGLALRHGRAAGATPASSPCAPFCTGGWTWRRPRRCST